MNIFRTGKNNVPFFDFINMIVYQKRNISGKINIDFVITGFHELFLADSAWVLNPSLDRSVWMFMTNMYQDVLIVIGAIVLGTAFVSMGGALVAQKKIKEGCKNGR